MHSLIKTALIAAIGTAIAATSPALAKSRRATVYTVAPVYGAAYDDYAHSSQDVGHPWGSAQIHGQYIKDDTIHNGNAY